MRHAISICKPNFTYENLLDRSKNYEVQILADIEGGLVRGLVCYEELETFTDTVIFGWLIWRGERYQGQGIGQALMDEVEEIARTKGIKKVVLTIESEKETYWAGKGFERRSIEMIKTLK